MWKSIQGHGSERGTLESPECNRQRPKSPKSWGRQSQDAEGIQGNRQEVATPKDITVLIVGEKRDRQRALWHKGRFTITAIAGPGHLSPSNAASIPKDLLEAELFGWEKGAFTGAKEKHAGKIESAEWHLIPGRDF